MPSSDTEEREQIIDETLYNQLMQEWREAIYADVYPTDYETIISNLTLPKEAMIFNGVFIEEAIPGYRTTEVTGRDSLSSDISELNYNLKPGALLRKRRHKTRDIVVKYTLVSNSMEAHRKALNKLRSIVQGNNTEEVNIIFKDEPDVFFHGTVSNFTQNKFATIFASDGEITIHCSDPFKYSVLEYEEDTTVVDGNVIFSVNYDGTQPAYPTFDVTHSADNGYVAFMDTNENIIQLGDPDIASNQTKGSSSAVINDSFNDASTHHSWDNEWQLNVFAAEAWKWPITAMGSFTNFYDGLYIKSASTGNGWHGPSLKRTFDPLDNFLFETSFYLKKGAKDTKSRVGLEFIIFGTNGMTVEEHPLVRICVWNESINDFSAKAWIQAYYKQKMYSSFNATDNGKGKPVNKFSFGSNGAAAKWYVPIRVERYENTLTVKIYNNTYTYKNALPEESQATGVGIQMYALNQDFINKTWENEPYVFGSSIRYVKMSSIPTKWKDLENKFDKRSEVIVNCANGEIVVNNALAPGYGALGNDFDKLVLRPGLNEIKCAYSDWATAAPTFKMRYRKVYL